MVGKMIEQKYYPPTAVPLSRKILAWNHWLNPLGNWHEPLPWPGKRMMEAAKSGLPPALWWALRNPLHNFTHFWIGIVPLRERYVWVTPDENGWERTESNKGFSWWRKGRIALPYYRHDGRFTFYIGWQDRGNFGIAFRRN
jgi:hypothetical protein